MFRSTTTLAAVLFGTLFVGTTGCSTGAIQDVKSRFTNTFTTSDRNAVAFKPQNLFRSGSPKTSEEVRASLPEYVQRDIRDQKVADFTVRGIVNPQSADLAKKVDAAWDDVSRGTNPEKERALEAAWTPLQTSELQKIYERKVAYAQLAHDANQGIVSNKAYGRDSTKLENELDQYVDAYKFWAKVESAVKNTTTHSETFSKKGYEVLSLYRAMPARFEAEPYEHVAVRASNEARATTGAK